MHAWDRRLRDLAELLKNCGEAYFSPDLFRRNLNQFLQTSRTITFIIQKHKSEIKYFDVWYSENVLKPWANDVVMTWAKDARNAIEKEGDLEINSTLSTSVVYSYIPEDDFIIKVDRPLLLRADVGIIAKKIKRALPPGVADAAVLCIKRKWVANTLPNHELVWALTYIYASLYRVCFELSRNLGGNIDSAVPNPTRLDPEVNGVPKTRYIKLGKPHVHSMSSTVVRRDDDFVPPPNLLVLRNQINSEPEPRNIKDIVERMAKIAEATFLQHGNHVPMTFLYDDHWNVIDHLTTDFSDHADKFLYSRYVANRASYLRAFAVVSISEAWLRNLEDFPNKPIREMKINGEMLMVLGATVDGLSEEIEWSIVRPDNGLPPTLKRLIDEGTQRVVSPFLQPIVQAMHEARRPYA